MTDTVNHLHWFKSGVCADGTDRQANSERENIKIISKLWCFLIAIGVMNHGVDVGYVHFHMNKSQVPTRECLNIVNLCVKVSNKKY